MAAPMVNSSSFQPIRHGSVHHDGKYGARPHAASHRQHSRPRTQRPPEKQPRLGLWSAVVMAAVSVAVLVWLALQGPRDSAGATELVEQMVAAVNSNDGATQHVLGGRLYTRREAGQVVVVADGLGQKECVQAGWALVKRGLVRVNGVAPQRVSAAVLAEMCAKADDTSKLEWLPKTPE